MNATIQAIRELDKNEADQEQKIAQARAARRALPTAKNAEYSNNFSKGIADRQAEIDRLFDEQEVDLTDIELTYGAKIDAEAANRDSLMKQLEESQQRLKRLEAEKTRSKTEKREHYAREIGEARKTIEAFEAAAGILAKPVE
jgi:phage host-nuclease inhibitor protein Gam